MPDELLRAVMAQAKASKRGKLSASRYAAVLRSEATVLYFATIAAACGTLISNMRLHKWPNRWARCPTMNCGKRQGRL
jgi:hypothetical protein